MEQHTDGKLTRKAKGRQTIYKAEQDVNLLMMIDDLKKRGGLAQDALMQIMTHSSSILCTVSLIKKTNPQCLNWHPP